MALVPFSDANQICDAFLALLADRGITPAIGGKLEDEFLSLTQLLELVKNPKQAAGLAKESQIVRAAAGIHDFAAKVLAARKAPEFSQFDEHLKLIATRKLKTTLSQTGENDPTDDAARKLVELYIACLAVHCGEEIRLDHPTNSKGDNPDILLSYGDNIWALAIKTPSSRHGQTLFENIQKAGEQIERSSANKGLVVLNVKNIIDHDALWRGGFANLNDAMAALKAELAKVCEAADKDRPAEDWDAVFAGKKTALPVLLIGQSVVLLPTAVSAQTPTPLKMMLACGFDKAPDQDGAELAHCLTHWMQIILRGEPGPPPS
ncbi:hypothetical protein ABIE85_000923 [Bradyrhizobium diazoefficiens]|uniref:hypothetical protein n=1 Tax=Bradyrhizobium diazoefficiens TaxID=1355477 RepID=UPI0035173ED8